MRGLPVSLTLCFIPGAPALGPFVLPTDLAPQPESEPFLFYLLCSKEVVSFTIKSRAGLAFPRPPSTLDPRVDLPGSPDMG